MLSLLNSLKDQTPPTNDRCNYHGCEATTREGKPYCSDHIEECHYIKSVLAEIDKRNGESKVLDSGRWISTNAYLIREAIIQLEHGTFTAARLGRVLDISERGADILIRQMARHGFVKLSVSETGAISATKRSLKEIID